MANAMHALIRKSAAALIRANFHFIHISTSTAPSIKQTGLYGYRHLKTPKGFQRFVDDAIERSEELVNYIAGMPSSPEIIRAMDEISDTVCSVIDSAELCRHTHPDREFVNEASKASLRVNEFLHYLNTKYNIYKAVLKAEKNSNSLTHEAQRAARFLRMDLEKGGIHLCSEKLDPANELILFSCVESIMKILLLAQATWIYFEHLRSLKYCTTLLALSIVTCQVHLRDPGGQEITSKRKDFA